MNQAMPSTYAESLTVTMWLVAWSVRKDSNRDVVVLLAIGEKRKMAEENFNSRRRR